MTENLKLIFIPSYLREHFSQGTQARFSNDLNVFRTCSLISGLSYGTTIWSLSRLPPKTLFPNKKLQSIAFLFLVTFSGVFMGGFSLCKISQNIIDYEKK
jgi:hypothetical protein